MSKLCSPKTVGASPQWLALVVLSAVGMAVYSNIFAAPFIFDSVFRIRENMDIRQLWPPWDWMTYNQRPVAYFTLAINYALHGYEVWGYHVVNLSIHLLTSFVLFWLVQHTFTVVDLTRHDQRLRWGPALAVALSWLTHPLQTQSVTYTIQRIESLMGLFYLLTLYCFSRAKGSSRALLAGRIGLLLLVGHGNERSDGDRALRGCCKNASCQSIQQQSNHANLNHCRTVDREPFIISTMTTIIEKPGESPFHRPAPGNDLKPFTCLIRRRF